MANRRVIRRPPSSLTTLSDERSESSWQRDLGGEEVEYVEEIDEDYSYSDDTFEDYTSEDNIDDNGENDEKAECTDKTLNVGSRKIDLGNSVYLFIPEDAPPIECHSEALSAERRTETLKLFKHHHDEIMVSDVYELHGDDLTILGCKPMSIQLPVVLPTTRLSVKELFRFHVMVNGDQGWSEIKAEFKNNQLKFPVQDVKCFVVYARPVPEFINVSPRGFTFVSGKDNTIRVEFPEGAVASEMAISVKLRPVDTDRIEWYRKFDPTAFEGIYALTDILSVRHKMESVLKKDTTVQLPIDTKHGKDEYELKCLNIEHGTYTITNINKHPDKEGQVTMPYTVKNSSSCQASCVRPGIDESTLRSGAMFQAGLLDLCTILMYISKLKEERYLTVEVVQSPNAEYTASQRLARGYFEIINSRSGVIHIQQNDQVRIDMAGNIQSAVLLKTTKYTFRYSSTSQNNSIHFRIQKNPMGGMPYSILTVLTGGYRIHEVHFDYPEKGRSLQKIKNLFQGKISRRLMTTKSETNLTSRTTRSSGHSSANSSSGDTGYDTLAGKSGNPAESPRPLNTTRQRRTSDPLASPHPDPDPDPTPYSDPPENAARSSQRNIHSRCQSCVSSLPEQGHPLLKEPSLLILAEQLPIELCQRILISLGMQYARISRVKREAETEAVDPVFLLLLKWYQSQKGLKSDVDLIQDLQEILLDVDRRDISETLKRVMEKGRVLKRKDFPS